jgi:hypothetical protein
MRRIGALVTLAVLSAVAMLGLTRCKSVSDLMTGPRKSQAQAANCITECAHQYNDSIRVESDLHVTNVHACAGDSACLALEDARHEAAVNRIQDGRKQCTESCQHQGGGSGH